MLFNLDVLDPRDFPYTPLPVSGGMPAANALRFLELLREGTQLAGMGAFEALPEAESSAVLHSLIEFGAEFSLSQLQKPRARLEKAETVV